MQTARKTKQSLPPGSRQTGVTLSPADPYNLTSELTAGAAIDRLTLRKLKLLGIQPAYLCSDAVFARRVYLDVIGTLPTPEELQPFLQDRSPGKRTALIDRLLERDEYADYWAMKWCDLLRVKSEFPINLWPLAVESYHHWIRTCLQKNVPYDQFAREMLTGSGSNFRAPAVNFYRAIESREPETIARTVALTFMGTHAEKWPKGRLAGMARFFSQIGYKATNEWKEEIVLWDPTKPQPKTSLVKPAFPDGAPAKLPADRDPRAVFTDWLLTPGNPWFARNIVNRIWYWLLGRGIIQEPDDIRPDNHPENPDLLAYLERELVGAHYDLKHIYRLILNSQVYQLSSTPRTHQTNGAAHFAVYPVRRLEAEVLIDAINQITGTREEYSSLIPEPFTFIPEDHRSITLADGSITSSFLEMFGRPSRDTGLISERNNAVTSSQRLHMLNSSHIQKKIERGANLLKFTRFNRNPAQAVTELYLLILSRYPTEIELKTATEHWQKKKLTVREAISDIAWALMNSVEFLYRH